MAEPTPEERRALFRIVRGAPTDDEIATLTAVLAAGGSGPARPPVVRTSRWNDPADRLRRVPSPGPGVWRTSTWPH